MAAKGKKNVLLTGASGYVGGRLLRVLEKKDIRLRCLARRPSYLQAKTDHKTEIVQGDVLDKGSLTKALSGIDIAFYLIHSMSQNSGFQETDRIAASNFASCAKEAGVQRIIYLGGLGDSNSDLSAHLESRQEVGEILRNSGVDTIELRSSIVLGSGSLSFELIRSLTEKLPVMIMPQWVQKPTQPIGIEDLLEYLVLAMNIEWHGSEIFEVGGADRVSYHGLMKEYARQRKLKRLMIPVPVLTPYLSSLWLGLVTPLYARIGRKLIDSISHPTIVQDNKAKDIFAVKSKSAAQSIACALQNEDQEFAETHWSDALSASIDSRPKFGGSRILSRIVDHRKITIQVKPEVAFEPIKQIGGKNGWYAFNFLWRIRGFIDLLVGGVGMRRHRPTGREIRAGDTVDFWRVENIKAPSYLNLVAEMKLPGKAWLEFEVLGDGHQSTIHQSAVFYPRGALGLLYWYGTYPLHALIFRKMIKNIGKKAIELKKNK
jgi:uncharacterized protein YbjT (DUF2867 family)